MNLQLQVDRSRSRSGAVNLDPGLDLAGVVQNADEDIGDMWIGPRLDEGLLPDAHARRAVPPALVGIIEAGAGGGIELGAVERGAPGVVSGAHQIVLDLDQQDIAARLQPAAAIDLDRREGSFVGRRSCAIEIDDGAVIDTAQDQPRCRTGEPFPIELDLAPIPGGGAAKRTGVVGDGDGLPVARAAVQRSEVVSVGAEAPLPFPEGDPAALGRGGRGDLAEEAGVLAGEPVELLLQPGGAGWRDMGWPHSSGIDTAGAQPFRGDGGGRHRDETGADVDAGLSANGTEKVDLVLAHGICWVSTLIGNGFLGLAGGWWKIFIISDSAGDRKDQIRIICESLKNRHGVLRIFF